MKRKICLLLCVSILINIICSVGAYAAPSADATSALTQSQKEILSVLQSLDIVSEEYDELTLDLSKEVTRAEFAAYLRRFANIPEREGKTLYYNDVSKNHYAYNDITVLTEYGYLKGADDKLFLPETVMQKEHAYSVFLRFLGYGVYMENNGVIAAANYAEITKNVSLSTTLTIGDLFTMMFNSLIANCLESDLSGTPSYSKGDTQYLYKTRKMKYFTKGIVTGVHGTSIYNTAPGKDQMMIDGETIELDDKDYFDYLGLKVHYIVSCADPSDEYSLIWIGEAPLQTTIQLFVDEDCTYDNNELTYHKDRTTKKYKLADNLTIIYNGSFYSGSVHDILSKPKYEIKLISVNNTNDLAIVWSYENVLVKDRLSNEKKVYNSLTDTYVNFDPNAYDLFSLVTTTGEAVAFEDIESDDVISVFISQNNHSFKGILSREIVSGNISSIQENKIEVNGSWYEYYDNTKVLNTNAKSAEFYLDYRGYIADASYKYLNANSFVAYVYNIFEEDDLNEHLILKILNENGKVEKVETDDTFKFNSAKKDCSEVMDLLEKTADGYVKPQLMLLQKNKDGKITSISTSSENGGDNKLIKTQEMNGRQIWGCMAAAEQNIIGVSMLYDENTKVFNVPSDAEIRNAKESLFTVTGVKDNAKYQNAVAYKVTTEDVFYEQYIVHKAPATIDIGPTEKIVSVSGKTKGLNQDDDIVDILEIMSANGSKTDYPVSVDCEFSDICKSNKTIEDVAKGDIIRIGIRNEEIAKIELIYKNDVTGQFFYGDGGWGLNQYGLIYGECEERIFSSIVKDKNGAAFKVETGYDNSALNPELKNQVLNLKSANSFIVVFDGKNFYKGSYNDINIGDFVVTQTHYNSILAVIVHKGKG